MITKLTKAQQDQIEVYRKRGLEIGNSTERVDFEVAKKYVQDLYRFVNLDVPEKFYFVPSPKSAQKLLKELTGENQYVPVTSYCTGSHESYWVQYYKYFQNELKLKYDERAKEGLELMGQLALHSGWFYLYDECAVICDRPTEVNTDENDDIHNDDGPAIKYSDGWCVYAVHGHTVPRVVIESPESITTDMIKKETNAETKRIMMEKYGVSKYLMDCDSKVLDVDSLDLEGSAIRTLIKDDTGQKWLIGSDGSTKRIYEMAVPDHVETCKEAHLEISGLDNEDRLIAEA